MQGIWILVICHTFGHGAHAHGQCLTLQQRNHDICQQQAERLNKMRATQAYCVRGPQ